MNLQRIVRGWSSILTSLLDTILCNFAAELRRSILSPVHGRLLHDHVKLSRGRETFQTADKASDVKANSSPLPPFSPSAIKVSLEIYHVSLPTVSPPSIPPSLIHEEDDAERNARHGGMASIDSLQATLLPSPWSSAMKFQNYHNVNFPDQIEFPLLLFRACETKMGRARVNTRREHLNNNSETLIYSSSLSDSVSLGAVRHGNRI